MAMTVADWHAHITKLETELSELEASPKLAEARQLVAQLEHELREARELKTVSTSYHKQNAELTAGLRKQNDIENRLRHARHVFTIASGEPLKLTIRQARYSLVQAEERANTAFLFNGS